MTDQGQVPADQTPQALPTEQYAVGEPVGYQPAPPKPRNKAAIWLSAVAVVFLLTTGAFGALWLTERGDHKNTTGQLNATRTEVENANVKLKDAETKQKDTDTKLVDSQNEKQKLEVAKQSSEACSNAAKDLVRALETNDKTKGGASLGTIIGTCR
jgi:hypothetical protein